MDATVTVGVTSAIGTVAAFVKLNWAAYEEERAAAFVFAIIRVDCKVKAFTLELLGFLVGWFDGCLDGCKLG